MSRPMRWLSRITAPFVWLLDRTSALVFRLLGLDRESKNQVTAEELHLVVAEAQTAGVLEEDERAMISGIVRLADRPVREVMTPRTEVDWIDVALDRRRDPPGAAGDAAHPHPGRRRLDRECRRRHPDPRHRRRAARRPSDRPRALCRKAPVIPDLMDAMDALAVLRSSDVPLAMVHDEYGHLDGIVTPGSILAALAGTFANDVEHGEEPPLVERDDGSWLVSGAASADLLADRLGHATCPADRDYSTVAGFALSVLKHLPETGETFRHDGWPFEIVDMDGRKIDKLIASRAARKRAGSRSRGGQLEPAELLLVAVDVAAREIIRLLDDPVAGHAARERRRAARRAARPRSATGWRSGRSGGSPAPAARRRIWGRRPSAGKDRRPARRAVELRGGPARE